MKLLSLVVFIPLQILFVPLALLGVILVAYRQLVVSKQLGVSQTAIEVLNGRWTMHIFGIRDDKPTANLAAVLPNTSLFGLWLCLFPLWLKFKLSGTLSLYPRIPDVGAENMADLVIVRTLYFDRIIERAIGDIEQFVVMGAGYDMRAYGSFRRDGVTIFELDQAAVQEHKRRALDAAKIPSEHVRFVNIDFSRDDLFVQLSKAGYDASKKTLFLWEGVTLYLSESEVRKTMQEVRHHSAKGSILLADVYANRMVDMGKTSAGNKVLEFTGEGFGFGLNFESGWEEVLAEFVESESMSVSETFPLGSNADKGPFVAVVEMQC